MNKNIYILPFDHRSSFLKDILKIKGKPDANDIVLAKELKKIIFEGFLLAQKNFKNNDLAILVDEQFGQSIINEARRKKITFCLPVEKTGQIFDFEYGTNFGKHILKQNPDFVKALVRYNPDNIALNKKQLEKLAELNDFCKKNKYKLLIELLVPPSKADLKKFGARQYEQKIRALKTVLAIQEISAVAKPAIWKLEGVSQKKWPAIIQNIEPQSKIIVLGRGESEEQVKKWLQDAALYQPIIGFAVGRTIFKEALEAFLKKDISRREAALWIAVKFSFLISLWQGKKKK